MPPAEYDASPTSSLLVSESPPVKSPSLKHHNTVIPNIDHDHIVCTVYLYVFLVFQINKKCIDKSCL